MNYEVQFYIIFLAFPTSPSSPHDWLAKAYIHDQFLLVLAYLLIFICHYYFHFLFIPLDCKLLEAGITCWLAYIFFKPLYSLLYTAYLYVKAIWRFIPISPIFIVGKSEVQNGYNFPQVSLKTHDSLRASQSKIASISLMCSNIWQMSKHIIKYISAE